MRIWIQRCLEKLIIVIFGGMVAGTIVAEDAIRSKSLPKKDAESSEIATRDSKEQNERDSAPACTGGARC